MWVRSELETDFWFKKNPKWKLASNSLLGRSELDMNYFFKRNSGLWHIVLCCAGNFALGPWELAEKPWSGIPWCILGPFAIGPFKNQTANPHFTSRWKRKIISRKIHCKRWVCFFCRELEGTGTDKETWHMSGTASPTSKLLSQSMLNIHFHYRVPTSKHIFQDMHPFSIYWGGFREFYI